MKRETFSLVQIENFWNKDKIITEENLGEFNRNIPALHGKYHQIYNTECIHRRILETNKKQLWMTLKKYYLGMSTREELKQIEREPFNYKILKTEVSDYIESDDEYCTLMSRITGSETKLKYLESILQTINRSSFIVKTQLDLIKFRDGEY